MSGTEFAILKIFIKVCPQVGFLFSIFSDYYITLDTEAQAARTEAIAWQEFKSDIFYISDSVLSSL